MDDLPAIVLHDAAVAKSAMADGSKQNNKWNHALAK